MHIHSVSAIVSSVAEKQTNGAIAQMVEQAAHIRSVRGPSPFRATRPQSEAFFYAFAIVFLRIPSPSISISTISPIFMPDIPPGVPVDITSPGSSVITCER